MSNLQLISSKMTSASNSQSISYAPILQSLRERGGWVSVDRDTARELVEIALRSGVEISERIALVDLTYWMDKQRNGDKLDGFRWFAARWRWKEGDARRLFEELGLLKVRSYKPKPTRGDTDLTRGDTPNGETDTETGEIDTLPTRGDTLPTQADYITSRTTDYIPETKELEIDITREAVESTAARKRGRRQQAEVIYQLYPRKEGKQKALEKIESAIAEHGCERIRERTTAYAEAVGRWPPDERRFVPHPATWYGQGRYDDDPTNWERTKATGKPNGQQQQQASQQPTSGKVRFSSDNLARVAAESAEALRLHRMAVSGQSGADGPAQLGSGDGSDVDLRRDPAT